MAKKTWIILSVIGALVLVGVIVAVVLLVPGGDEDRGSEEAGREYMVQLNEITARGLNVLYLSQWNYETNITDYTEQQMLQESLDFSAKEKEYWEDTITYNWQDFEDENLKRQFEKYALLGTSALSEEANERLLLAVNNMKATYARATICDYNNLTRCDLYVEPDVTNIFATSENPDELRHAWVEWHNAAGAPSKNDFIEYVSVSNEAARLNGFASNAEWWIREYEDDTAEEQFRNMWSQIQPLYEQVHAYVRRHLRLKYGENVVSARGPIPAHILGNIWAQSWSHVESFSKPFPEKPDVDVTAALVEQNYTALLMFQKADEFYQSLNLDPMPDIFWEKSILERPNDGRDMVCHASAWDFFDGEDFRVRQCTTITNAFFKTTHHEMGHIQYYLEYKDQPAIFRRGANPGFHEAVADVAALSVSTPKHLRLMGLLEPGEDDLESDINQLYKMILDNIVFLPFAYILDLYRYSIFRGTTSPNDYNCHFWQLRESQIYNAHTYHTILDNIVFLPFAYILDLYRYSIFRGTTSPNDYNCHFWQLRESVQGIEPPVTRTEDDFDAAAKYHISADVEYMRYYVSYIIQFQFHRGLCLLAGEYAPGNPDLMLHNCDIYNSTAAGAAFAAMLRMGSSRPWPDAMEVISGERIMDAGGILEYFQPLYDWLREENERNGEYVGWEPSTVQYCTAEQRTAMENSEFLKGLQDITGR